VKGLLDTGSGTSLLNSGRLASKLKLPVRPVKSGEFPSLFAAEGSKIEVDGLTDITFNISGLLFSQTVYVVPNICESLIFGTDFMIDNNVIIDYANRIVSLCSDIIRTPLISITDNQHVARLTKSVCIPPHSEQIVHIKCAQSMLSKDILVEPISCRQFNRFAVARTICATDKTAATVARILNCEQTTLVIPKGTKIATVSRINVNKMCEPLHVNNKNSSITSKLVLAELNISNEQLEEFATDYGFQINPDLEVTQRQELLCLLYKYRSCFARNLKEMRRYINYELELTLKGNKPSYQRQYKLSSEDALECHRQITEMAECGIIEPAKNSKYQSAMFTVRKSNGTKRCVVDMRNVNKNVIQPFLLQLPDMNQLLHSMADQQAQYYSCLDLASGFYQIPLKEGVSRDVTSFSDPLSGLRYSFCVSPFGLQASPAALILTLMNIMGPLISQSVLRCYMDDLCSAGNTWPETFKTGKNIANIR